MTNRATNDKTEARLDILEREIFAGRALPDLTIKNRDGTTTVMRRGQIMPGRAINEPMEIKFDGMKA